MIIDKVRERSLDSKFVLQKGNFIKKNMVLIKFWNEYNDEKRRLQQDSLQTNIETALKRKNILLKLKREKKAKMTKLKEQMRLEEKRIRKNKNLIRIWMALVQQRNAAKSSWNKFQAKKQYIRKCHLRFGVRVKFYYNYKKTSIKKAPTMDLRATRDVQT